MLLSYGSIKSGVKAEISTCFKKVTMECMVINLLYLNT